MRQTTVFGQDEANETTLTSAGDNDTFIARFGSNGDLLWARRAGGVGDDSAAEVAATPAGSVLLTGTFDETAVFGQGQTNETCLTAAAGRDMFVAMYFASGNLAWARSEPGTGYLEGGTRLVGLSDSSLIVTGWFIETITFGQGEPNETELVSAGNDDMFVAKYSP
jgi:hypothetical protein